MTPAPAIPTSIVGLDLGQAQDSTGLVVVRPNADPEPTFDVGHVERLPLGMRYPAVVAHVGEVVGALRRPVPVAEPARGLVTPDVAVVVDYTGVGRPVADMLIDANLGCTLILVTITGGDKVVVDEDYGSLRVPKRDLASVVQRLLQEGRLRIGADLPMAPALSSELAGFRVKINLRGHDSYGAGDDWRSAPHDDLVLSLALACWWGEQRATVEIY